MKNRNLSLEGLKEIQAIVPEAFVMFGTTLGVVRDGGLMEHDGDVDVGILLEDWDDRYLSAFANAGFSINRRVYWEDPRVMQYMPPQVLGKLTKVQMTYQTKEQRFCFNILATGSNGERYHYEGQKYGLFHCPADFVEQTCEMPVYDTVVNVPADTEAFLAYCYGAGWRVPQKEYYWTPEHMENRARFIIEIK